MDFYMNPYWKSWVSSIWEIHMGNCGYLDSQELGSMDFFVGNFDGNLSFYKISIEPMGFLDFYFCRLLICVLIKEQINIPIDNHMGIRPETACGNPQESRMYSHLNFFDKVSRKML